MHALLSYSEIHLTTLACFLPAFFEESAGIRYLFHISARLWLTSLKQ